MSNSIGSVSYASTALAFLVLCAVLLTRWRGRPHARVLAGAGAVTVLWAIVMAWDGMAGLPVVVVALTELLRDLAWSLALLALLGQFGRRQRARRFVAGVGLAYLALLAVSLLDALTALPYFQLAVLGRIGMAVLGMLMVEQLYRHTDPQKQWAIKFACLGMGSMYAYDFYLYSDAFLFRALNPELWAARGVIDALTAPLLALALARNAVGVLSQLVISRRMLFHSAALLASALYLLAMSAAAYCLRYVGGSWGSLMQLTFLFGAILLLAGIIASGTARARLKVFLSKHFYRYNYDYREEWLRFTRVLSQPGPGLGERSVEAMAALVGSPAGALWLLRDSARYEAAAHWRMPQQAASEPADSAFSQFVQQRSWLVDLQQPDGEDAALWPAWLQEIGRAWLLVPLMLHGRLFGFVLLLRPPTPVRMNWEVIDLLKIAGSQAASCLAQQEADNALMLARQFDSFHRMSTFVVHDLKNLVAQLSLLTANAERHRDNPEFQADMRDTVVLSVQKMKLMLQKLSRTATPQPAAPLPLARLLEQAVAQKAGYEPRPQLTVKGAGAALYVMADPERLERVMGHLIQNAIEATPRDGSVGITVERREHEVCVTISDSGSGMSEDFIRERLFKPFDSTKAAGMGIGAFESREYIGELGGQLDVASLPQAGTTFTVRLPLFRHDAMEQAA